MRIPPNSWLVIDANQLPGRDENPTVEMLRRHAGDKSFRLIAAVITHFHSDHYSGMVDVLQLCEAIARNQKRKLHDVVGALVLPRTFEGFKELLTDEESLGPGNRHLRALLGLLPRLEQQRVKICTLDPLQFAWPPALPAQLRTGESWVFTLYPALQTVIEELFTARRKVRNLRRRAEVTRTLQERGNRYAYVLGVGCGRHPGSLHFVLTSDVPGTVFCDLTRALREEILPDAMSKVFAARQGIRRLVHTEAGIHRLRPAQGITVPHHGSAVSPARHDDLSWWLDERRRASRQPAVAIVQGGPNALGQETVDELALAGLRIFATSRPEQLLGRYATCKELDGRLPVPLVPVPVSASCYTEVRQEANTMLGDPDLNGFPAHLAVQGGEHGVVRIVAKDLYEICSAPAGTPATSAVPQLLIHHALAQVFPE